MQISFAQSPRSTLGVEWEVALVDSVTGELVPLGPQVVEELDSPLVTGEFMTNTVEMVTGVCHSVAEAENNLKAAMSSIQKVAASHGLGVLAAGTHPFSSWRAQRVSEGSKYQKMLDRTQHWGRQMVIYGVHVHVGIESRDKALPIMSSLLHAYPHLLALSANSPFWEGEDTGFASHRSQLFQQLPTAGLPFQFTRWSEYESFVEDMMTTGVIDALGENRWDIRPAAHLGTLEYRNCDSVGTIHEIGAITALIQCLVEEASRQLDDGQELPMLQPWHVQENKWRAARYGLDAVVITGSDNSERLVTDELIDMTTRLAPIAADLDCAKELARIPQMIERGAGYQRQHALAVGSGGDLRKVVLAMVEETAAELR